jgi:Fe-S-cluster-containing dehydrogenase component
MLDVTTRLNVQGRKTGELMLQRIFIFDMERCFGCNGCVAACANVNDTPGGVLWRNLHKLPPENGRSDTVYLSVSCNHCENPPCVSACPAAALEKRESDGVVLHYADKCIGCRYCTMACPYDAIKWEAELGVVSKCHFCHERLEESREPACVETCFAGALNQLVVESPVETTVYKKDAPGLVHIPSVGPSIRFITRGMTPRPPRIKPFPPRAEGTTQVGEK